MSERPIRIIKGRGTGMRPQARYDEDARAPVDDGWAGPDEGEEQDRPPRTIVVARPGKTIITRNDSPDLPFSQSINPYLGCEHGCIYCYARPSYAYWDLSPGLDFETRLFAKSNAPELLRAELSRRSYRCEPVMLGANTDAYQPIEREWKLTRRIVEVLCETRHPLLIVTKSALVERDIDLLAPMAAQGLAQVAISVGLLDGELARRLEPRAAAPHRRLQAIRTLAAAGIPVTVLVAPIIPQLNDKDLEAVLEQAREAGATAAYYVMLRLPHELKELFRDWLQQHYPLRAAHVMSLVQQMRGGKDNDSRFGKRMTGEGIFAELIRQRFAKACARLGLERRSVSLRTDLFVPPPPAAAPAGTPAQLDLFKPWA
ncbi:MAG: PA0069 family radical SAM protein [Betaproteobacteria bacterium]|nr:PA0069 family radical SAM protein [Betaproteobacteria bacterium]